MVVKNEQDKLNNNLKQFNDNLNRSNKEPHLSQCNAAGAIIMMIECNLLFQRHVPHQLERR